MVYFQKSDAVIEYHEAQQLLEVTLNGAELGETDYILILSKAMAASKQFNVRNWVTDLSKKSKIIIDDNWILNCLMPSVKEAGLSKLAFIMHDDFTHDGSCKLVREMADNGEIPLKFFNDKELAHSWVEEINN